MVPTRVADDSLGLQMVKGQHSWIIKHPEIFRDIHDLITREQRTKNPLKEAKFGSFIKCYAKYAEKCRRKSCISYVQSA